jgi:RNA recognition motif-containing protein
MLRQAFELHGEVIDAFVAYNGRSSRGFGYVTFKEGPAAAAALAASQKDGVHLGDEERSREIRVEMARERPGPRPEPRDRSERTPRDGDRSDRPRREGGRGDSEGGRGGRGGRGRGRGEDDGGRGEGRSQRRPRSSRGKGGEGEGEGKAKAKGDGLADSVAAMTVNGGSTASAVEESSES